MFAPVDAGTLVWKVKELILAVVGGLEIFPKLAPLTGIVKEGVTEELKVYYEVNRFFRIKVEVVASISQVSRLSDTPPDKFVSDGHEPVTSWN